ncbi:FAD-dependent monooxygenase [Streptomyces sp. c-19]|uniref:FAD-dependent monooxygenase n=1 Tax=Streptomyces sp. c-19 TaxID=2789275 RepID=UPI00397EF969
MEPRAAPGGPELRYAYNVRRSTLDPLIRSLAAETPGVDLLLGHQVTGLVREAGRTVGVRASTPGGEREIRARLVVGADGKDSAVAKFAEVPTRRPSARASRPRPPASTRRVRLGCSPRPWTWDSWRPEVTLWTTRRTRRWAVRLVHCRDPSPTGTRIVRGSAGPTRISWPGMVSRGHPIRRLRRAPERRRRRSD